MNIFYEKEYVDHRFGFPVRLLNVPMKKVHGSKAPWINADALLKTVTIALIVKSSPLIGLEVKHFRLWLGLSMAAFGKELGVTHVAVKKWEDKKELITGTNRANDSYIRLMVLEKLLEEETDFSFIVEESTPKPLGDLISLISNEQKSTSFLSQVRALIGWGQDWLDETGGELWALPVSRLPTLAS